MSKANSFLLLLLTLVFEVFNLELVLVGKLPLRTERERSSIEFEQSENIGQFVVELFFNYFKTFKTFKSLETLIYQYS